MKKCKNKHPHTTPALSSITSLNCPERPLENSCMVSSHAAIKVPMPHGANTNFLHLVSRIVDDKSTPSTKYSVNSAAYANSGPKNHSISDATIPPLTAADSSPVCIEKENINNIHKIDISRNIVNLLFIFIMYNLTSFIKRVWSEPYPSLKHFYSNVASPG